MELTIGPFLVGALCAGTRAADVSMEWVAVSEDGRGFAQPAPMRSIGGLPLPSALSVRPVTAATRSCVVRAAPASAAGLPA